MTNKDKLSYPMGLRHPVARERYTHWHTHRALYTLTHALLHESVTYHVLMSHITEYVLARTYEWAFHIWGNITYLITHSCVFSASTCDIFLRFLALENVKKGTCPKRENVKKEKKSKKRKCQKRALYSSTCAGLHEVQSRGTYPIHVCRVPVRVRFSCARKCHKRKNVKKELCTRWHVDYCIRWRIVSANVLVQPVLWKMRLEMAIGMQIEIINRLMKLPFYGAFQIFKWKVT